MCFQAHRQSVPSHFCFMKALFISLKNLVVQGMKIQCITNRSIKNFTVISKLFTCIWYISIKSASHLFPYLNEKLGWNIKSSYKSSWECSSSLTTEQIKSKAVCKLWTGLNLKLLVKSYFPICSLCFALHSIHLMDKGYKFSLQYFLNISKILLNTYILVLYYI